MPPTRNTLSETIRVQSVENPNQCLAAVIDPQAQVKQAHRRVRGPRLVAIHDSRGIDQPPRFVGSWGIAQ